MWLVALIAAVGLALSAGLGYIKGSASRNPEIAELHAAIRTAQVLADEAEAKAAKTAAKVVVEYRDRIKTIREVTPGEIQLVEVVRQSDCTLSPAWRVLHDSAASGSSPAQDSSGPVGAAEAIETVTENYRIARENAARLEALQSLVKSQ